MAPVSQYVTLTKTSGPESLSRFNLFNCISANVTMANGYSSGDIINAIKEVAQIYCRKDTATSSEVPPVNKVNQTIQYLSLSFV